MSAEKEVELKDINPTYTGSKDDRGSKVIHTTDYKPVTMQCGGKDYQVCCHMSWRDVGIVTLTYLAIWGFVLLFFVLLLEAALLSDEVHTVLWMYFYVFIVMIAFVAGAVATKPTKTKNSEVDDAQEGEADEDEDQEQV